MVFSACFSSMKIVSLKYCLVEAGHWWVFAVGMMRWPGLWRRVLPYFIISMLGVVFYTMIHHGFFGFRADQALLAPMPFFPDHTMYATVLVLLFFFVPLTANSGATVLEAQLQKPVVRNGLLLVFFTAILLSTSRAALLSFGITALLYLLYYLQDKPRNVTIAIFLLGLLAAPFALNKISKSLSNDVSFQERLNRWDCAERMLDERPFTGFGPGTYPFQYLSLQQPEKMTRISTRAVLKERSPDTYGRGGSAHSEYWQAASELGWPGCLIWITLVISTLWTGFSRSIQSPSMEMRSMALLISLGLLSYFIHAFANNFLHDGRIAALVWGAMVSLNFQPLQPLQPLQPFQPLQPPSTISTTSTPSTISTLVQSTLSSSINSQHFPSGYKGCCP